MRWAGMLGAGNQTGSPGLSLNRWLSRDRCIAMSGVLLSMELFGLLFIVAGTHGLVVPLSKPVTTDFVSFYAAGQLADAGTPALAYDRAAHQAAEESARAAGIGYVYFYYPPIFLLICSLLARLPYIVAFFAFEAVALAMLLLALRRILDLRGWRAKACVPLLPFLAYPAVWANAGFGQNAFLTAALFGWALLILPTRPLLAGLLFGALSYKPHFGLLLPIALAAGGHWRAFAGAALSVAICVALSVAAFGVAPWFAYAAAVPAMPSVYQSGSVDFAAMVSPLGAARVLGLSPFASYIAQALSTLMAALAVAWVWRRGCSPALCAATLLAGTLLAMPMVLFYDLVLAVVAIAFLVRHTGPGGWLMHEKLMLGAIVAVPVLARGAGAALGLPLGPLAALLLMVLCLARARREAGFASSAQPAIGAVA